MDANPGDPSTESPSKPEPKKWEIAVGVVMLALIVAVAIGGAYRGYQGLTDDSPETEDERVELPAVTTAPTLTPEEAEKMIYVCQTVASAMLKLNQEGLTKRETVLFLANELDITLEEMSYVFDICINYFGNLTVE